MAHVFITGAGRGIGLALAKVFAESGHQVSTGVRDPEKVKSLLPFSSVIALDVADERSVAQLADHFRNEVVDIVINNAGVIGPQRQSTTDMDFAGFLDALNINTLGPLRVTQGMLPSLRRSKAARIAIISSRMGSLSHAASDRIAYRASKAAVNKVSQGLATDLAADGITVAAFHPGWVRTDMGGGNADIDVTESAAGIKAVIDSLTLAQTGQFWNYDGTKIAW
jgi:NAD(P)-dependent dehydrogenase (short-subunit alcohol dehydrogenase family)